MKMNGNKLIKASRQDVWDALNDPEKLKLAIPGAEKVEKKDDNNLTATVKTKIGPISAKFNGKVVFQMDLEASISTNPYISFQYKAKESGKFDLEWIDDNGEKYSISKEMVVS